MVQNDLEMVQNDPLGRTAWGLKKVKNSHFLSDFEVKIWTRKVKVGQKRDVFQAFWGLKMVQMITFECLGNQLIPCACFGSLKNWKLSLSEWFWSQNLDKKSEGRTKTGPFSGPLRPKNGPKTLQYPFKVMGDGPGWVPTYVEGLLGTQTWQRKWKNGRNGVSLTWKFD